MVFVKGNIPWSKGKKVVPQKVQMSACACGCGEQINNYDSRNRYRKNAPRHRFHTGLQHTDDGYIRQNIAPNVYHPQHRMVVEAFLGRKLLKREVVHHWDENKANNNKIS